MRIHPQGLVPLLTALTLSGLLAGVRADSQPSGNCFTGTLADGPLPIRHVFGGSVLDLDYELLGPVAGTFDAEATLYAVSERLAAPLERETTLEAELLPLEYPHGHVRLRFSLPEVEKRAALLLLPRVRFDPAGAWFALSPVRLRLHPPDLLDDLKARARDEPLAVAGESHRIEAAFSRQGISYRTARRTPSGDYADKGLIFFAGIDGRAFRDAASPSHEQVFLVFIDDFGGMPRTVLRPDGSGFLMEIKMPVLERLAEDPLAQETFIEIIETARRHLRETEG